MMIRITTVALALLCRPAMATITFNEPSSSMIDSDGGAAAATNSNLRGLRSSAAPQQQQQQQAEEAAEAMLPQHLTIDLDDTVAVAAAANEEEEAADYYLRGIRSEDPPPSLHHDDEPSSSLPPQPQQIPLGADKPKIRHHSSSTSTTTTSNPNSNPLQKFAQNMLTSQGCPPTATTTCGSICYVLTPEAASDLHSVATGLSTTPTHHWHDPTSFWSTGVCNAKSQCVSVNPFDVRHDFDDLKNVLEGVERECDGRGGVVGMGTMFVLAKAMEPPAWLKRGKK